MKSLPVFLRMCLFTLGFSSAALAEPQDNWYLAKEFRGEIEPGKFYHPHEAAIGPDGNLYVADRYNHQIQVFDATGIFLRRWGSYGAKYGEFNEPTGIHISPAGKVYVCEASNHRVQVFNLLGTFLQAMGTYGNGDGQLNLPHGLTVDDDGNVYVAEHNNARITAFRPDGTFLRNWGSAGAEDGQFQALIALCRTPANKIAALERDGNRRIQVFNPDGTLAFKFGSSGSGDGQLDGPHGIETDASGNFYIPQHGSGERVTVFSSSGTYLRRFGSGGSGNGQFSAPFGLALSTNGNAYVCDWNNHRIAVFRTNGTWVRAFGSFGRREFDDTHGIAVDAAGNVYISDHQKNEIRKFDSSYNFIKRFGSGGASNGQFNGPLEMTVSPSQRLYVVDHNNHRVQYLDLEGNFLGKFGGYGSVNGTFKNPWGVGVGDDGRVYVADLNNHRVQVFDASGNFLFKFGSQGSFDGLFQSPLGLAIAPDGVVAVADAGNERIQIFTKDGAYLEKYIWPRGVGGIGARAHRVLFSSDGLLYAHGNADYQWDKIRVFTKDKAITKQWDTPWCPMAETKTGDLIAAHGDRVVRVWRRSYRGTETWLLRSTNTIPFPYVASARQRPGTTLVDVDFSVKDGDNTSVQAAAVAWLAGRSDLGGLVTMRTFAEGTGSVLGNATPTGTNLRLVWNAGVDWSTNFASAQVEILAKDNRGLMDIQYLTINAPTNQAPLTISKAGLTDADFLNLWVWLIATGNSSITLTNGTVKGVGGSYGGKTLASGSTTTADGRAFLLSLLNAREATSAEVTRASSGAFGFIGGGTAVVRLP